MRSLAAETPAEEGGKVKEERKIGRKEEKGRGRGQVYCQTTIRYDPVT